MHSDEVAATRPVGLKQYQTSIFSHGGLLSLAFTRSTSLLLWV